MQSNSIHCFASMIDITAVGGVGDSKTCSQLRTMVRKTGQRHSGVNKEALFVHEHVEKARRQASRPLISCEGQRNVKFKFLCVCRAS